MKLLYIKLPEGVDLENVCIKFAPINSSGDVYHMLTYIILSIHDHCDVPRIVLTYDIKDRSSNHDIAAATKITTGTQCLRMMNFASFLGYREYFVQEAIACNVGYTNVREHTMREHLVGYQYVIDHRMLTAAIANYFFQHQHKIASGIVRAGFNQYTENLNAEEVGAIHQYADESLQSLLAEAAPIVVLHLRHSSKANDGQNTDIAFSSNIVQMLSSKGYKVICIYTDSRITQYDDVKGATLHLRPFQHKDEEAECGFSKLYHLRLLVKLFDLNESGEIILKCIVGNTSGTLDLAAFIGHRVLNFHHFSDVKIDYQAVRLILQSTFMSILERLKNAENLREMLELDPMLLGTDARYKANKILPDIQAVCKADHLYTIAHDDNPERQDFVNELWDDIRNFDMDSCVIEYLTEHLGIRKVDSILHMLYQLDADVIKEAFDTREGTTYSFYNTISSYMRDQWKVGEDGMLLTDPNHLYTDDQIQELLGAHFPEHIQAITAAEFLVDPLAALNNHLGELPNGGAITVPVNINGNHWVGLVITQINGQYVGVYIDPLGHNMPEYLHVLLGNIFPIQVVQVVQQTNGVDCGPLTVANLVALGTVMTAPDFDINNLYNIEQYIQHDPNGVDAMLLRENHHALLNPTPIHAEEEVLLEVGQIAGQETPTAEEHLIETTGLNAAFGS